MSGCIINMGVLRINWTANPAVFAPCLTYSRQGSMGGNTACLAHYVGKKSGDNEEMMFGICFYESVETAVTWNVRLKTEWKHCDRVDVRAADLCLNGAI